MKTLAIVIRSHGTIPIHFNYGLPIEQIFSPTTFDYRTNFNIQMIYAITLAKVGGVCYGSPDVESYVYKINKLRDKLNNEENVKSTEDLVNYLYDSRPKIQEIQKLNEQIFGISFLPEITSLDNGYTVEKVYDTDKNMKGLGIYYLSSDGLTGLEINNIKNILATLTNELKTRGFIYKTQILNALREFNLFRLYYIDFTCFAYHNLLNVQLNEDAVNWLNSVMQHEKLRGGKKFIYKMRNKKTKHNKKQKYYKKKHNKTKKN